MFLMISSPTTDARMGYEARCGPRRSRARDPGACATPTSTESHERAGDHQQSARRRAARRGPSLLATIRFSCEFSRPSSFSRLTSSAFIPPYCARQRWNVFSETSSAFGDLGDALALRQQPIGLAQLPDDLLRRVTVSASCRFSSGPLCRAGRTLTRGGPISGFRATGTGT
jgi:hypothetical protein